MKRSRLTQLPNGSMMDLITGEIFDVEPGRGTGTVVLHPVKVRLIGWCMVFQGSLEELAKDRELWGQPMAVLLYLVSKMDFENGIFIQQVDIAKALDIDKHQTCKAIKKLVDKNIIVKAQKVGNVSSYSLNDYYGWKGKVSNMQKARRKKSEALRQKIHSADNEPT